MHEVELNDAKENVVESTSWLGPRKIMLMKGLQNYLNQKGDEPTKPMEQAKGADSQTGRYCCNLKNDDICRQ